MHLQAYKRHFFSLKNRLVVLGFCMQILEVRGCFVFSVLGASRVGIRNCKRCWKAGLEGYLMKIIRSACVHIHSGIFSM